MLVAHPPLLKRGQSYRRAVTLRTRIRGCGNHASRNAARIRNALETLYDATDIVEANDPSEAEKAAMIIRAYGHAVTETMHATPWKEFLPNL